MASVLNRWIPQTRALVDRLHWLTHPLVRLGMALGWTLLVTVMLVQSSAHPVVGPAAPPGLPDLRREIELTTGHVIVFGGLTVLWWWALLPHRGVRRALFVAVGVALVTGVITEMAQSLVPDRQVSWFDVATNWTVTLLAAFVIQRRFDAKARSKDRNEE